MCGLVWRGLAWFDVVLGVSAWFCVIWHGLAWFLMVPHGSALIYMLCCHSYDWSLPLLDLIFVHNDICFSGGSSALLLQPSSHIYPHYELKCLEKLVSYTFCYILDTLLVSKVNAKHLGIGAKLTCSVLDEMLMVFSIWSISRDAKLKHILTIYLSSILSMLWTFFRKIMSGHKR